MKKFIIIFILLLIQNSPKIWGQEVSLKTVKIKSNTIDLEITYNNSSSEDILFVSPNLNTDDDIEYFIIPEVKTKELKVRRYLFSYPAYVLDVNEPCFNLKNVKAGESYKEHLSLEYPIIQSNFFTKTNIDIRSFDSISFQVGVIPYDTFIANIPNLRPFGKCVVGEDKISEGYYEGKKLIDVQNILKTNTVKIN